MVIAIFAFSLTLLISVLFSDLFKRTVLSVPVLFLITGFIVGDGLLGLVHIPSNNNQLTTIIEVAMVALLYSDGMRINIKELASIWALPGRALLLGLPLTIIIMAIIAHFLLSLSWIDALLVGAVLSPTDPVFAEAIVTKQSVPLQLRRLLNVESGMNDGLAFPIVLAMIALAAPKPLDIGIWLLDVGLGIVIGIAIPWLLSRITQIKTITVSSTNKAVFGFSILLLVYTIATLIQGNIFLAAFTAGILVMTVLPETKDSYFKFGEILAELLKLGSLFIIGSLLSVQFFQSISLRQVIFALMVVAVVRPLALFISLLGVHLGLPEFVTAAWFGPRGFASVVYGLYVFQSGISNANALFELIVVVIISSMIIDSSTDVFFVRWFRKRKQEQEQQKKQADQFSSSS